MRSKGIAAATLKNRVGWLRFWAEKTGKVGMIPRDNAALGIAEKSTWKGKRAATTPADINYADLKYSPMWDGVRDDPRFGVIMKSLAPKNVER